MRAERGSWLVHAIAGLWLLGLSLGARAIYHYSTDGGATGATPEHWPSASALHPAVTGATAVVFLHPDCPCSGASVHELESAVRVLPLGARVIVVFEGTGDGSLWAAVGTGSIERVLDDGAETARFGARTSGYTVVYDAQGALAFHGGITGSRGHAGDNVGRRQFTAALQGKSHGDHHPVFGCALSSEPQ